LKYSSSNGNSIRCFLNFFLQKSQGKHSPNALKNVRKFFLFSGVSVYPNAKEWRVRHAAGPQKSRLSFSGGVKFPWVCSEVIIMKIELFRVIFYFFIDFGFVDFGFVDFGFVDFDFVDFDFVDFGFVDFDFVDFGFVDFDFVDFDFVDFDFVDFDFVDFGFVDFRIVIRRMVGVDTGLLNNETWSV
jgi:hypothetical protein